MSQPKKILVAPLNWGLGHATRCVPIINALLQQQTQVILGGDGMALSYLKKEFPELESIRIPDLKVRYPKSGGFLLYFALRLPQLFSHVKKENALLKKLVREHKIEGVISDNRYGLYHKKIPSIIITHQLYIKSPAFKSTLRTIVKKMISRFAETWVPDSENEPSLSGKLSHANRTNQYIKYIGILSRFTRTASQNEISRKILVVLSGPEPFRTYLENLLTQKLLDLNVKATIVRGVIEEEQTNQQLTPNLNLVNFYQKKQLEQESLCSEFIIARAGYSTIMDLVAMNKKALLIPTPGQTEQEYLAKHLNEHPLFVFAEELEINLKEKLNQLQSKPAVKPESLLFNKKVVSEFLAKC